MNSDSWIEQVRLNLQSGNRNGAKNILRQSLQAVGDDVKAGLLLVKLELEDQCPVEAMEVLSVLWKRTRHAAVGDLMADLSSTVIHAAVQRQQTDRKIIERIAGLLKAIQGPKKILVDTLEYDIIGGLAIDALRLVPIYREGLTGRTGKTVVFFSGKSANPAMVEMLSRELPVFSDPDFPKLIPYTTFDWSTSQYKISAKFTEDFFGKHADLFKEFVEFTHSTNGRTYCLSREQEKIFEANNQPRIHFTAAEEEKGGRFLRDILRLPQNAWFACVYARDGGYYNESPQSPNWFRNSDIRTYCPAIDEILACGGYVVRVGSKANQKLNHPDSRVFDYSSSQYCDPLLDIYLAAKCRFFLGVQSGYSQVNLPFHTPQLMVNAINCCGGQCDVWIPKKMVDTRTNQLLPYAEFYKRYYGYGNIGLFAENGINQEKLLHVRYIDNTPDEIAAAAVEMMSRLDGTYVETDTAKKIREQFVPVWKQWKVPVENHTLASCFIDSHPQLFMTMQQAECVIT